MQIGYARVSTDAQDLTTQRELLAAAGCQRIFAEKITGTRADRPELARMIDHLRAGDAVTVTSLDRLARSTPGRHPCEGQALAASRQCVACRLRCTAGLPRRCCWPVPIHQHEARGLFCRPRPQPE